MTASVEFTRHAWAIVVFAARESVDEVKQTLAAIRAAMPDRPLVVDLLVNGDPVLARALGQAISGDVELHARLWSIPAADKSNAWSQYLHRIWSGEELVFFVDGYVRVRPDALRSLGHRVLDDAEALGGTGVPSVGRTAAATARHMVRYGGFHGNLCCMKGHAIADMRRRGITLPIGLYRVDSLVAGLMHLAFDPCQNRWDGRRVVVDAHASWDIAPKRWWQWRDLVSKYHRTLRQARGLAENAAIKFHLMDARLPAENLPRHMCVLLREWRSAQPEALRQLTRRHPLVRRGLKGLTDTTQWPPQDLEPRLLGNSAADA